MVYSHILSKSIERYLKAGIFKLISQKFKSDLKMCGIVGYIGFRKVGEVLYSGLKTLEYRGYDSAGEASCSEEGITVLKDTGKVDEINSKVNLKNLEGNIGIAHTRWATHGGVSQKNSHPHVSCNSSVAVVHNGII